MTKHSMSIGSAYSVGVTEQRAERLEGLLHSGVRRPVGLFDARTRALTRCFGADSLKMDRTRTVRLRRGIWAVEGAVIRGCLRPPRGVAQVCCEVIEELLDVSYVLAQPSPGRCDLPFEAVGPASPKSAEGPRGAGRGSVGRGPFGIAGQSGDDLGARCSGRTLTGASADAVGAAGRPAGPRRSAPFRAVVPAPRGKASERAFFRVVPRLA